jgi:hypothetical protein
VPAPLRLTANNARDGMDRRTAFYSCQYKACGAGGDCEDAWGNSRLFTRGEIDDMVREGRI